MPGGSTTSPPLTSVSVQTEEGGQYECDPFPLLTQLHSPPTTQTRYRSPLQTELWLTVVLSYTTEREQSQHIYPHIPPGQEEFRLSHDRLVSTITMCSKVFLT